MPASTASLERDGRRLSARADADHFCPRISRMSRWMPGALRTRSPGIAGARRRTAIKRALEHRGSLDRPSSRSPARRAARVHPCQRHPWTLMTRAPWRPTGHTQRSAPTVLARRTRAASRRRPLARCRARRRARKSRARSRQAAAERAGVERGGFHGGKSRDQRQRASVRRSSRRAIATAGQDRWCRAPRQDRRRWPTAASHPAARPDRQAASAPRRFQFRCAGAEPRTPAPPAPAAGRCRAAARSARG